jgi:hypothetical protein
MALQCNPDFVLSFSKDIYSNPWSSLCRDSMLSSRLERLREMFSLYKSRQLWALLGTMVPLLHNSVFCFQPRRGSMADEYEPSILQAFS